MFRTLLEMPITERHARATALRELVAREDLSMWLAYQFHDIRQLLAGLHPSRLPTIELAYE